MPNSLLDFKNKPNSRYALLEQFKTPTINLLAGATGTSAGGVPPNAQYAGPANVQATFNDLNIVGGLSHAINQTTFFIKSSFGVQADIALKLAYQWCSWEFALGYNFWARSQEKICNTCARFPSNLFALKGDAQIYGFQGINIMPMSATESNSDIHAGTNTPIGTSFNSSQYDNPYIDNAQPAQTSAFIGAAQPLTDPFATAQTNTSLQPILLSDADINYCGIPRALTNRVFAHISYTGEPCDGVQPFAGIGGSAEFAPRCGKNKCNTSSCSISQWAVWLKLGVAYN